MISSFEIRIINILATSIHKVDKSTLKAQLERILMFVLGKHVRVYLNIIMFLQ